MPQLKYLASLSEEIDKFTFDTEAQAQQLIEKNLGDLVLQRDMVLEQAQRVLAERRETIVGLAVQLDKAAGALGNSSGNPPPLSRRIGENIDRAIDRSIEEEPDPAS